MPNWANSSYVFFYTFVLETQVAFWPAHRWGDQLDRNGTSGEQYKFKIF